jgi:hypothetical protein
MVLLAATAMKWHAVAHTVLAGGWRNNPVLVAVQLVVEPSLALWLMSGYFAAHAAGVAACVFVVFAFVSLHSAIDGATSCGCFGTAAVNPWLTTSCDATLAILLWLSRSRSDGVGQPLISSLSPRFGMQGKRGWRRLFLVCGISTAITATAWRVFTLPGRIDIANGMTQAGGLTILEPEKWVGGSLPIKSHLQPPQDDAAAAGALEQGEWEAVIYHADCDTCRKVVPQVAARASGRTAFIELPPYGEPLVPASDKWLSLRLSDQTEWFAQTPIVLQLKDGRVMSVKKGEQAAALAKQ